jgi:hypothetical protein
VYTEDAVKTAFDIEVGTGRGGDGIDSLSRRTTPKCSYERCTSQEGQRFSQVTGVEVVQIRRSTAHSSLMTINPYSCVDPFFKPPGRVSEQGHEAIDHCKSIIAERAHLKVRDKRPKPDVEQVYRGTFHPLNAMLNCGLVSRVRGTAAFFQLLAFSSWHLAILRNDRRDIYSLQHAAKASQELQKQIRDPNTCTTVELIMAVLVFASSSVSYCVLSRYLSTNSVRLK